MPWEAVEQAVPQAKSIAFDGCHKIYVLLDDDETKRMQSLGYRDNDTPGGSRLYTSDEISPESMLTHLREWFNNSCSLRFISSVTTNKKDPNAGFTSLIGQFEDVEKV